MCRMVGVRGREWAGWIPAGGICACQVSVSKFCMGTQWL